MTKLGVIRHGPTDWNRQGLVQGSTDIPLGEAGERVVETWQVPKNFETYRWVASPLSRAVRTAEILSGQAPQTDPRIAEMCWGAWEGSTLPALREELGDLMVAWEAKGLDFKGPGGESPREVQVRMRGFLIEIAERGDPTLAVCHKGVIRALYATAIGWDMADNPPHKLLDDHIQLFDIADDGTPTISDLNIKMLAT